MEPRAALRSGTLRTRIWLRAAAGAACEGPAYRGVATPWRGKREKPAVPPAPSASNAKFKLLRGGDLLSTAFAVKPVEETGNEKMGKEDNY